jgi:hypothetical protein
MAQPRRAPSEATVPINLHWNQKEGYFATPQNPDIDPDATAQLNASDKSCTICFNPTTTPFGTCQNVKLGDPPIDIPVGPTNFTVNYCITDYQATCTAPGPKDTSTGTIKVGSGEGGR